MNIVQVIPGKNRKAGNALGLEADKIIRELRGERDDEIIQNAMDDLFSLREINKDIDRQFEAAAGRAGMTLDDLKQASNIVNGDLQTVGNITSQVPEAITVKYAKSRTPRWYQDREGTPVKNETRFHTKTVRNPVTGQLDVVPFVAQGETVGLSTQFGLVGKDIDPSAVDNMDSDEFLGKRMLQLAGLQPERNNSSNVYAVDLRDAISGNKVDVEMIKAEELKNKGTVGFQVFTETSPDYLSGQRPRDRRESNAIAAKMAEALKPLIKKELQGGRTLKEAIDILAREGLITNSSGRYGPTEGKLLKEGGKYVDQLVQPVVKKADAQANLYTKRGKNDTRKLVMPLEGALLSDANAAKELLETVQGREAFERLSLHPMPGNNSVTPSAKVYLDVDKDDRQYVQDLAKLAPAVRQLFGRQ